MHPSTKYSHPKSRLIAFFLITALASVTLVLIPDVYDSTLLKTPLLFFFSGLVVATTSLAILRSNTATVKVHLLHMMFVMYLLASTVSTLHALQPGKAFEAIAVNVSCFVIFSAGIVFRDSALELKIQYACAILVAVTVAIGIIQTLLPEYALGFFSTGTREPISTFGNKSYFAGFLTLFLPVIAGIGIANKHRRSFSIVSPALIAVMLYLLVTTESRTSWLAAGTMLFVFFFMNFQNTRKRLLTVGIAVTLLLIAAFLFSDIFSRRLTGIFDTSSTSTFSRRLYFYEGAWRAFLASPVIGNGAGNFSLFLPAFRSPDYWMSKSEDIVPHAHNEYLEILSETGAPGVLLFIGIFFLFFRFGMRSLNHNSGNRRTLLLGMLCGIAGVLIDGMASMNLRTIPVVTGFWLIAGISTTYLNIPYFEKTFRIFPWMRNLRYIPAVIFIGGMLWYAPIVYDQYNSEKEYLDGLVYKYQGNIIGATSKFSDAIRFNPLHAEARLYLAANYIEQKQFQAGYDQLTDLLTYHPYIPKGHLLKAVCAFELGKFDENRKEMNTELRLTTNPQSLYYAALFAEKNNRPQEERYYLLTLLEKCIAGSSTEYVPAAIQRLGEICRTGHSSECDTIVQHIVDIVEKFRDIPPVLIAAAQFFTSVENATEAGKTIATGLKLQTLNGEQRRILEELQKAVAKQSD